jgi:hypothetical protein
LQKESSKENGIFERYAPKITILFAIRHRLLFLIKKRQIRGH